MCDIIKRDGRIDKLKPEKISNAITNACQTAGYTIKQSQLLSITGEIVNKIEQKEKVKVEDIHKMVESSLNKAGLFRTEEAYRSYRKERDKSRSVKSKLMKSIHAIGIVTDRDNANVGNNFSAKLLRIASESNKWHMLTVMPKEYARLHETGDLYIHDLDSYNLTINCLHVPTKKILENGFNPGYGTVNPPKRIETAAELSCIAMQATQNDMFGGQSHPNFDNDLSEFLAATIKETEREVREQFRLYDKALSI